MGTTRTLVMVVEDDADSRASVVDLLGLEGYAVVAACDGRDALRLLRDGPVPAVILLDLRMPVMDGWQLRSALLESPRLASIPVVVLSAEQRRPPPPGTSGLLTKPVDARLLLATLQRLVR